MQNRLSGLCGKSAPLAFLLFAACAAKSRFIEMPPIELRARQTPTGPRVDVMDPEYLFKDGVAAYEKGEFEEAEHYFSIVLDRFPESRFAKPSLYNRGVTRLRASKPAAAAADFREFLAKHAEDQDKPEALQRLGTALVESGEWKEAVAVLRERLRLTPITLLEEVEARAQIAFALRMLGRIEACRKEAAHVLLLHSRNVTAPGMEGNYYVAMASFHAAEALRDVFSKIRFVLPVERMEKDLQDKATLFLKAQSEYLRTIRLRNTYWGVKAGMAMARLYEDFFDHLLDAEVPPDLTQEELEIYFQELKRRARPLLVKALRTYERHMAIAKAYGAKDEWFGDARERIERLRTVLQTIPEGE